MFEDEISKRLTAAGVPNVAFVDTMKTNLVHDGFGELHCATNAYRQLPFQAADAWWRRIHRGARAGGNVAHLDFDCCPTGQTWDSTLQRCKAACPGGSAAGNDQPYEGAFELGRASGTFAFSYNTYSIKDRVLVKYEGATLFDTGCVGQAGNANISYNGTATTVIVSVEPNCAGETGTAWDFNVACPAP